MSIEKRRFIRFSLDLPAVYFKNDGETVKTLIQQISIGGCLTEWDAGVLTGDQFRLEIELPNKNRLPLYCKALYKFEGKGIGAKFLGITRFEQELISSIISHSLASDGLPLLVDPFTEPPGLATQANFREETLDERRREEAIAEEIMSARN